jgi:hypothetical protein
MLEYQIDLNSAPAQADDVVNRHVFLTVGNTPQQEIITALADHLITFTAEEGDPVAVYLRDEDDQGNLSEPGELNAFTATDTLPPPAPGKLAVVLINDNVTTTPAPTTTAAPTTTEEPTTTTPAPE